MLVANKFPIGVSSFEKIIESNSYYIDKTQFVEKLVTEGDYYFLSRPRRFGKSLFLDTLKQAFLGKEKLFKGLYLENNWNWEEKYPVIHLSFGAGELRNLAELTIKINELLQEIMNNHQLELINTSISGKFQELIKKLKAKYKQNVVILIDEYDKPMLDNLANHDVCVDMRSGLRDLYSAIKDSDAYIKFVFITGVSKFSKVSLFSGLNNLRDLTYNQEYGAICGYTQKELEATFNELIVVDELPRIKSWYNGYNFMSDVSVYNPFSILNFFADKKTYRNYWFSSGSPNFLINLLIQRKYYLPELKKLMVPEIYLDSFDIEKIDINLLLFQSGYLTVANVITNSDGQDSIEFSVPNKEVELSLNAYIVNYIYGDIATTYSLGNNFTQALVNHDFTRLKDSIISLFASIPYNWYVKNDIAHYEGFYCSLFYAFIVGMGHHVIAEDVSSKGRVDLTIIYKNEVYIFELKTTNSKQNLTKGPLEQIKFKGYANKYIESYGKIYAIGLTFNEEERNLVDFKYEQLKHTNKVVTE